MYNITKNFIVWTDFNIATTFQNGGCEMTMKLCLYLRTCVWSQNVFHCCYLVYSYGINLYGMRAMS